MANPERETVIVNDSGRGGGGGVALAIVAILAVLAVLFFLFGGMDMINGGSSVTDVKADINVKPN